MAGLDTSKTPSKMEMVKLSFDKDLREAATNVRCFISAGQGLELIRKLMTQLKEAGVELDAAVCHLFHSNTCDALSCVLCVQLAGMMLIH